MKKTTTASLVETPVAEEKEVKRPSRSRKKVAAKAEEVVVEEAGEVAAPAEETKSAKEAPAAEAPKTEPETRKTVVKNITIPPMPRNLVVRDIVDLWNARIPLLNDQQIQMLTLQEAQERHLLFEAILVQVLDYDIVLSDTNIWLELLVGHTSNHSDPKVNARLMFERQLEFISRMMKKKGGRFIIMSETYEEIDRFASAQEPTNYQNADWEDPALCRNVSARLAKRLILSQQRENRLRIEGITCESHHGSFADPAIIRRVVELFASGKKVLVITNDASVAIRSMGMCDDLQRINNIDDTTWDAQYAPIRPMAITMDDLKQLDNYTRQYHFLQQAAGAGWMQDMAMQSPREAGAQLKIDENAFRPGDKRERRTDKEDRIRQEQQKEQQRQAKEQFEQQRQQLKQDQQKLEQQRQQLKQDQQKLEQQRQDLNNRQRRAKNEKPAQQEGAAQSAPIAQSAQNSKPAQSDAAPQEVTAVGAPAEAMSVEQPSVQPLQAESMQVESKQVESQQPTAEMQPAEPQSQNAEGQNQPDTEAQNADSVATLPSFTPEDMALISTPAPKRRTHRGGRRRSGNGNQTPKQG